MSSYGSDAASVALRRFLRLCLPDPCLACGLAPADSQRDVATSLGLCARCRLSLAAAPKTYCTGCGRPLAGDLDAPVRCAACRRRPPAWDALVWAFAYAPPLDTVIAGLKFRRLDYLGPRLGRAAVDAAGDRLRAADVAVARCDAVVPVPLHWRRRWVRGYDQARLVAEAVAEELGLPVRLALRRRRSTRPQSLSERENRKHNLSRAFTCIRPDAMIGRRVLLVDDVLTTGATLDAATRTLTRAGATVVAFAAARTPLPEETSAARRTSPAAPSGLASPRSTD